MSARVRAMPGIAFQVLPSPSRYETSAASMMSCSSAYTSMAETRPPSWPTSCSSGSAARARQMSLKTPLSSSDSRGRPNMNVSISGSQARKRGQAPRARRARLVAVAAVSRSAEVLDLERFVDAVGVVVSEHVVGAGDDAPGAARAQPRRDDLGVEVLPRERPAFLLFGLRLGLHHRAESREHRPALGARYPTRV